jgi:H+/gluconate symporter-like permease
VLCLLPESVPVASVVLTLAELVSPDPEPPVAAEPAAVVGAAVEIGVIVAAATQAFRQSSYTRFSAAVPSPWSHEDTQLMVAFC